MSNLEVRGYRWRYTVLFGTCYATSSQLYYLLCRGHFEPFALVLVAGLTILWAFFVSSRRLHLRIVDDVFSGPPPRGFRRVHIRVEDIDRARSSKVGLFGGRTVWSRTGEAIYVDPVTVPKAGRTKILQELGLIDADAVRE